MLVNEMFANAQHGVADKIWPREGTSFPKIWPVHYALAVAGIAVIRNWMKGDETAEECAEELRSLTNRFSENSSLRFQLDIPDMDVESGYGLWADTCDDFHNPLIAVEGPIIRQLIDSIPPGRALDAACGTGRYARYLSERGHAVSGVDLSPELIEKARANTPASSSGPEVSKRCLFLARLSILSCADSR